MELAILLIGLLLLDVAAWLGAADTAAGVDR